jgi:hypothetical protein
MECIQDDGHKRDGRYAATVMHEVETCTNFACEDAQTGRQLSPGDQKNQKKPKEVAKAQELESMRGRVIA